MRWRRGGRGGAAVESEQSGEEVPETPGWFATPSTGAMAVGVTAVRWGVLGVLMLGTPLSVLALASGPEAAPVRQAGAPEDGRGAQGAGPAGFAALYVQTYVSAVSSEDGGAQLAAFFPEVPSSVLSGSEGPGVRVESASAVRVESVSSQYWSVTVAARIVEEALEGEKRSEAGSRGPVLRYFQVPVREVGRGGLVAVSLPSEVAGPGARKTPELGYGQAREVVRSAPLVRMIDAVLAAYVAGKGELAPYLSPGAVLKAVAPAPYERVVATRVAEVGTNDPLGEQSAPSDGERRRLLVQVEATSASGVGWPLSYAIELKARDGRWEVAELAPAPVLPEETKGSEA